MVKGGLSFRLFEHPRVFISPLFRYYGRTVEKDFLGSHWTSPYGVVDLNFILKGGPFRVSLKVEKPFRPPLSAGRALAPSAVTWTHLLALSGTPILIGLYRRGKF